MDLRTIGGYMKHVVKWVVLIAVFIWMIGATLGIVIVIDRQKRFEAFATAHIDLLMQELSETNVNASILEQEVEKFREEKKVAVELQQAPQLDSKRCGPAKNEEKKK